MSPRRAWTLSFFVKLSAPSCLKLSCFIVSWFVGDFLRRTGAKLFKESTQVIRKLVWKKIYNIIRKPRDGSEFVVKLSDVSCSKTRGLIDEVINVVFSCIFLILAGKTIGMAYPTPPHVHGPHGPHLEFHSPPKIWNSTANLTDENKDID